MKVSGRILIDFVGYSKHHDGLSRTDPKVGQEPVYPAGRKPGPTTTTTPFSGDHNLAATDPQSEKSNYIMTISKEKQEENKKNMLAREEDLIFVSPMLKGFCLKNKLWC